MLITHSLLYQTNSRLYPYILKVQCLFFYLLISFTMAKYKQNCSLNKLVRFLYQRISLTATAQHSNFDAIVLCIYSGSGPLPTQTATKTVD